AVQALVAGHHGVEAPFLGSEGPLIAGVEPLGKVAAVVIRRRGAEEMDPEKEGRPGWARRSGAGGPGERVLHCFAVLAAAAGEGVPTLVVGIAHVAEESAGAVVGGPQQLGQSGQVVGKAIAVLLDTVTAGIEAAQQRGERRPGGGTLREGAVERHAGAQLCVEVRTGGAARIAVSPEAV